MVDKSDDRLISLKFNSVLCKIERVSKHRDFITWSTK